MLRGSHFVRLFQLQGVVNCQSSILFFFGLLIIAAILSSLCVHLSSDTTVQIDHSINQRETCPTNYSIAFDRLKTLSNITCPDYFWFIHEDLKPWRTTGITRAMVEKAKKTARFRLVIVDGKAYVEKYKKSIQTRDVFTIWGILQLLRRYPGKVPDLELMFDCDDRPVIRDYYWWKPTQVPPLFRYCGDRWTKDIVFPDWSFWGWNHPELILRVNFMIVKMSPPNSNFPARSILSEVLDGGYCLDFQIDLAWKRKWSGTSLVSAPLEWRRAVVGAGRSRTKRCSYFKDCADVRF
ncbi:hypothetical protein ACLB2K_048753 [Fragaria x ananassa]